MATLFEYYASDFNRLLSCHSVWTIQTAQNEKFEVTVKVHLDFDSNTKFLSFFIPNSYDPIVVLNSLLGKIDDAAKIADSIQIQSSLPGEEQMCSTGLHFSGRIFFYYDGKMNIDQFRAVKEQVIKQGLFLHLRDNNFSEERSKIEKPLAFISHDNRDKDKYASEIASGLQKRMCPIWYDEFSLKVGDSLRESIEKGLKECKKCVLILSPNFISNNGWTKVEFNSIFTREILEAKNLVLPVWCGVSKRDIFEYCPTLLDRVGLQWDEGINNVINRLHQAIISNEK